MKRVIHPFEQKQHKPKYVSPLSKLQQEVDHNSQSTIQALRLFQYLRQEFDLIFLDIFLLRVLQIIHLHIQTCVKNELRNESLNRGYKLAGIIIQEKLMWIKTTKKRFHHRCTLRRKQL